MVDTQRQNPPREAVPDRRRAGPHPLAHCVAEFVGQAPVARLAVAQVQVARDHDRERLRRDERIDGRENRVPGSEARTESVRPHTGLGQVQRVEHERSGRTLNADAKAGKPLYQIGIVGEPLHRIPAEHTDERTIEAGPALLTDEVGPGEVGEEHVVVRPADQVGQLAVELAQDQESAPSASMTGQSSAVNGSPVTAVRLAASTVVGWRDRGPTGGPRGRQLPSVPPGSAMPSPGEATAGGSRRHTARGSELRQGSGSAMRLRLRRTPSAGREPGTRTREQDQHECERVLLDRAGQFTHEGPGRRRGLVRLIARNPTLDGHTVPCRMWLVSSTSCPISLWRVAPGISST